MNAYSLLTFIHILSSTLLFGTGLGTAFFMWFTWCGGNLNAIATAARLTVRADWLFTTPAVIVQPVTGVLLMRQLGFPWDMPWLRLAIALYLLTGLCWLPVVYLQMRVRNLARAALESGQPLPPACRRLMHWWFALGWPAFLSVMGIFWLMIARPML
jgi:uncharacterized membrane protein